MITVLLIPAVALGLNTAGGSYVLDYSRRVPVNVNDTSLLRAALPVLERAVGKDHVRLVDPWMAADDYAYLAAEVPACLLHLGTVKPGTKSGNNHTPTFMADDAAIPVGMRVMLHLVLDYLARGDKVSPVLR